MFDRRTIKISFTALTFALAVFVAYIARSVLIIFVFSILFAYLINPAVRVLQKYSLFFKDLKGPHILEVYLGVIVLSAVLAYTFAHDLHSHPGAMVRAIPELADRVASGEIAGDLGKSLGWTDARITRVRTYLQEHRSEIEGTKRSVQQSALKIVGSIFVIPILAIFFLSDGEKLVDQLILIIPAASRTDVVRSLAADLNVMLQRYIRAKVTLGALSFVFCSGAMLVLGFSHWLALGVIAGILEFIPIAGWMMAAATIGISGALVHAHWIWMLVLLGVWRVSMDYAISPRVMGHQLEMHPLLAIFTVMVGGAVGGIVGVYISIPLVACFSVVWRRLPELIHAKS
jgi:predicted PurR-regulated permease PerM